MILGKIFKKKYNVCAANLFQSRDLKPSFIKYNNKTRVTDTIKAQLLTQNNMKLFEAGIKKWEYEFACRSPYDFDLQYYNLNMNGSRYLIKQEEMKIPLASLEHPLCLMLSSANDVEGLSAIIFDGESKYTRMPFIGIAPWNIYDSKETPRYSRLSYDLTRYSMLIALKAASSAFSATFTSARGKLFILKMLGRTPVYDREIIYFKVNKTGIEAFIAGKMDIFKANASIK